MVLCCGVDHTIFPTHTLYTALQHCEVTYYHHWRTAPSLPPHSLPPCVSVSAKDRSIWTNLLVTTVWVSFRFSDSCSNILIQNTSSITFMQMCLFCPKHCFYTHLLTRFLSFESPFCWPPFLKRMRGPCLHTRVWQCTSCEEGNLYSQSAEIFYCMLSACSKNSLLVNRWEIKFHNCFLCSHIVMFFSCPVKSCASFFGNTIQQPIITG